MYENETLSVIIYFFNKFDKSEAEHIWGSGPYSLGEHMYNKFSKMLDSYGPYGAPAMFICDLDSENYKLLIDRACELYNGRRNRK